MFSIDILVFKDAERTTELCEKFKNVIPDKLKNKYPYREDALTHFPIPRESEEYHRIKETAKEYGVPIWHFYELVKYSEAEKKQAAFFEMNVSCALEAEGTSAASYGTQYTNCCPICKIGGTPVGDILVDRKFVKKYSITSLKPDVIVSKQVKWLIESNGFSGVHFDTSVRDYKGRKMEEFYRLSIENVMAPANEKTWFSVEPPATRCEECGMTVPYLHSNFYYKEADLTGLADFNLTFEYIDNWNERMMIVSRRVMETFKKYKIRVGFNMINIV